MTMKIGVIFDLDQTLIDSSIAQPFRDKRKWPLVYESIPQFKYYDGMQNVFDFLKKNQILYSIVTSSPSAYCNKVCTHWNFDASRSVCYHDTTLKKPHPEPILLAIKKLNIPPDRILSFGDRDIDIIASQAAKTKAVACTWGATDLKKLLASDPNYVVHQPIEIINLIEEFI